MSELRPELKEMIVRVLMLEGVAPDDIGDDDRLFGGALGLDSVDAAELAIHVEDVYGAEASILLGLRGPGLVLCDGPARGLAFAPHAPYGEGAAALLLLPDGEGPTITLEPGDGAWMRAWRWPDEAEITADPQRAHDARLGLYGCVDLVAMACLARTGGSLAWRGAAPPTRARVE